MARRRLDMSRRKRFNWRDVLTFVLFFGLAAVVWFGHAMRSVRNTRVPVLVSYTGVPATISFEEGGLPDTIIIEVRDAGQRLNSYLRDPLRLTIDLRSYIHGDKGKVHIPSDALRRSISDILQGTSRLIATTPEEIVCGYYTEEEKTVCIALDCLLETAKEYQLVETPTLNKTRIKIYGSRQALDLIDTIYTQRLEMSNLSDTTIMAVALAVPKGIRAERDSVVVSIYPERYTEKKVIVPLHVQGVPEGQKIRLFPREVEATLRVGMSHFSQVAPRDVKAVCTYSAERKDKLEVELRYTNPYITAAWVYPAAVEFIIEQ